MVGPLLLPETPRLDMSFGFCFTTYGEDSNNRMDKVIVHLSSYMLQSKRVEAVNIIYSTRFDALWSRLPLIDTFTPFERSIPDPDARMLLVHMETRH